MHFAAEPSDSLFDAGKVRTEVIAEDRAAGANQRPPIAEIGENILEVVSGIDIEEVDF